MKTKVADLLIIIQQLQSEVKQLVSIVEKQSATIKDLKQEIRQLKNLKNSKNSSVPPSKNENRASPNHSLREKSEKKVGGQIAHKGHTLQMRTLPDIIENMNSNFCSKCGFDISDVKPVFTERRQVIDIPLIKAEVKEYRLFSKTCIFGHCNKATAPNGINAPIQYGHGIEAMVVYLGTRQYLSIERIQEYFSQTIDVNMSKCTIQNILVRMAKKAMTFHGKIKEKILLSNYVSGDETSVRINGSKGWMWTLQNQNFTLLYCTNNRGYATLESLFPNGLSNTIVGHDAYAAWYQASKQRTSTLFGTSTT